MKTGAKLKNLRKMKKLSQEEVSKVLNLSYSTLSRWENDTRIPTYEDLFKLGQFYGVSVDYLSDPNEESFYWSLVKETVSFEEGEGPTKEDVIHKVYLTPHTHPWDITIMRVRNENMDFGITKNSLGLVSLNKVSPGELHVISINDQYYISKISNKDNAIAYEGPFLPNNFDNVKIIGQLLSIVHDMP